MNPINDKMPTKDSTDVQKLLDLDKSTELSKISSENFEKINSKENVVATGKCKNICPQESAENLNKDNRNVNNHENKDKTVEEYKIKLDNKKLNTINEKISASRLNKDDTSKENSSNIEDSKQQKIDTLLNDDTLNENKINHRATDNASREACDILQPASEEETEDFEDVEDVEIPEEEEVDEIIVPDETEAEDLTDGRDNDEDVTDKILNEDVEDEEDGTSKDSEMDTSLHEEETTKSSEVVEKDEDSDKKSFNNDAQEETSSKDYEEEDIDNLSIEPELVASEEDIRDAESTLEEPKSNETQLDEDTTSQARYDPLNCADNKEQNDKDTGIGNKVENENSLECQLFENDKSKANYDDEDDEVQFVETRNSPIFIESDDDDGNSIKDIAGTSINSHNNKNENSNRTITTATTTVTVPKNITVTRTSARKSTAKLQHNQAPVNKSPTTVCQIQNKSQNFHLQKSTINNKHSVTHTSTQHIVDCIELLDSSDEESAPTRNRPSQQQKTPQKRTLLAAKGNYYKNSNNKIAGTDVDRLPNNFSPYVKQQPKKPAPPPLPPPTPQSNFLNAVQLQPALVSGSNPPAFSALLSNKSVIIPNAFYGNPPRVKVTPDTELERRYGRWLENFLNQFCKPQFVATHSCFVFLQRALKYKDFVRIKALRTNMSNNAQSSSNQVNTQLMTELRTIFLKSTKKISYFGRRFCELTCSTMPGKAVALMAHGLSGKVTLKTCSMDLPKTTNTLVSSAPSSSHPGTNSLTRKRQLDEDEDEYTPDKSKIKTKAKPPSESGDEDSGEMGDDRKRSLRTKRTKRIDNSFSYNEDDLLAEYEIDDEEDEKLVQLEIQRKIEQKRLEAEKQRQQQVKSFESAFIQAFAKSIDGPTTSSKTKQSESMQRIRLKNTTTATVTSIRQYTANNDAEDLLQATWIENLENDETQIISDDDEPKEHRIYKQQQQQQHQQHQQQSQRQQDYYLPPSTKLQLRYNANQSPHLGGRVSLINQEEIITGDDDYDENDYNENNSTNVDPIYWPKNVDSQMYVNGKLKDRCVICNLTCQRLVHHYVNEHRGCEVYNSRLSLSQIKLLKQGSCTIANVSLYKNGQFQYEAFCIFCQKKSRFMLPYWYQHFTMHTGEYAYRCIGCGIRKPTRSLLTQHQAQGCPEVGGVAQDYAHDSKSLQIEAKICNLCNYVQLHRSNIVKHLHTQHYIKQILPKHIQTIVLMKTPATLPSAALSSSAGAGHTKRINSRPSSSHAPNTYIIADDDDNDFTSEEIIPDEPQSQTYAENKYYNYIPPYMQAAVNSGNFSFENVDAGDDLSFMICGMLDVQMNSEAN